MPLKDHKQELWCVTAIASMLRHQAVQKNNAQLQVGMALKAVLRKKKDDQVEQVSGSKWGAW